MITVSNSHDSEVVTDNDDEQRAGVDLVKYLRKVAHDDYAVPVLSWWFMDHSEPYKINNRTEGMLDVSADSDPDVWTWTV